MMTVDNDKPVHVHVDRNTPVHVHLKKKKKKLKGAPTAVEERLKHRDKRMTGILSKGSQGRSVKRVKSASPPFIPAPARTSKGISWENESHRLDISPPSRNGAMNMDELSTSEEELVHGKMRNYEKKISSLMNEVGTLKNEMDLRKSLRVVEKKDEQLDASRRILQDQERELQMTKTVFYAIVSSPIILMALLCPGKKLEMLNCFCADLNAEFHEFSLIASSALFFYTCSLDQARDTGAESMGFP
ncbi:predicted protein [Nematostella vectensis]|uniref:Uncharacterized protein n=1 Tax=Nematostella vectensis TaxID=45351 RepID=A7SDK9_NEMVE|nr:predicted protein [Nematostella vectensis]|eukprot:XP_001630242.1 predicted protein [Nematostella vectensis]